MEKKLLANWKGKGQGKLVDCLTVLLTFRQTSFNAALDLSLSLSFLADEE